MKRALALLLSLSLAASASGQTLTPRTNAQLPGGGTPLAGISLDPTARLESPDLSLAPLLKDGSLPESPASDPSIQSAQPASPTIFAIEKINRPASEKNAAASVAEQEPTTSADPAQTLGLVERLAASPIQLGSAYDGTAKESAGVSVPEASPSGRTWWRLWARGPKPPKPPRPKTPFDQDDLGGPPRKELSVLGRILYGARWSVNLLAIGYFLEYALQPLINSLDWPLWLPASWLQATGRVELMTALGPQQLAEVVQSAPVKFLLWQLPRMTIGEELMFRLIAFGLVFFPLAALRRTLPVVIEKLDHVEDLFRIRSAVQFLLRGLRWVAGKAFLIAAGLSALAFAVAHFPTWGIHPYTILVHAVMGLGLAHVAYRSRSLLASTVAHYMYNLGGILLAVALPLLLGADLASTAKALLGLIFAAGLYYNWRSYRQDKAAAIAGLVPASGPVSTGRKLPRALLEVVVMLFATSLPALIPWGPPAQQHAPPPAVAGGVVPVPRTVLVGPETAAPKNEQRIFRDAAPSVVQVLVKNGAGSGFIVDGRGLLVTNAHVAGPAGIGGRVGIRLSDLRTIPGTVVGINAKKDLALIQLPPAVLPNGKRISWPTLPLADSDAVQPGDFAAAMGFPFAGPLSISRGIISGTQFRSNDYEEYLQTDASVNPGNSGGPLLDGQGRVIGVNTWGKSISGGSSGVNFAITSKTVRDVVVQFHRDDTISPVYLGFIADLRDPLASEERAPLRVQHVRPGSPAQEAGLRPGDVILALNDVPLRGGPPIAVSQINKMLSNASPGTKITLRIRRDVGGQPTELGVSLTLGDGG